MADKKESDCTDIVVLKYSTNDFEFEMPEKEEELVQRCIRKLKTPGEALPFYIIKDGCGLGKIGYIQY